MCYCKLPKARCRPLQADRTHTLGILAASWKYQKKHHQTSACLPQILIILNMHHNIEKLALGLFPFFGSITDATVARMIGACLAARLKCPRQCLHSASSQLKLFGSCLDWLPPFLARLTSWQTPMWRLLHASCVSMFPGPRGMRAGAIKY